ncbi:MAG: SPOR domain-containing protein [Bacteroidales bacterium]|jgi:hypothetical protein|nr:SPOR domain-containing protein [Bacteroidales bacterium]
MILILFIWTTLMLDGEPVKTVQDARVERLVNKHIEHNRAASVNGFRINIFSQSGNNSRSAALVAQTAFTEKFPELKSYISFEEPYFKVKIGNFRTRLEASAALEQLKDHYPQAYVVRDALDVKDLLGIEPPLLPEPDVAEEDVSGLK